MKWEIRAISSAHPAVRRGPGQHALSLYYEIPASAGMIGVGRDPRPNASQPHLEVRAQASLER